MKFANICDIIVKSCVHHRRTAANEDAQSSISSRLSEYFPDINAFNTPEKCAKIFRDILIESAISGKNKKATSTTSKSGQLVSDDGIKNEFGLRLIMETNGICPNDNCYQPLYVTSNGKTAASYEIAQIDPKLKPDSYENLIALCPKCKNKYLISPSQDDIKRMADIKRHLMLEANAIEALANSKIEAGVNRVLRKISNTPVTELIPLNYNPVEVKKKIKRDNVPLFIKIQSSINIYYLYVENLFQQLSKEGQLRFDPFSMQVKLNYWNLRDQGLSQSDIYYKLVDWLAKNTNESKEPCEVIVSYFVQKCEVFDVIAE
ncbi:ABC-three component system protein [Neobacillus fumarioli]|uniref:ABC-three component system protein n=1 Tax=Neobacillus fumarioli TaxID=105229 RepID=UPI0012EE9454|nr:ABC-three component system protein [Neobacillus fumarioli]